MTQRPGSIPLSHLHAYTIAPHLAPADVAERGEFYIRDGWLRPALERGHMGTQVCYVVEFVAGERQAARFALEWSPLREQVLELVLRSGELVGPCRLISKPLHDGVAIWVFIGLEDDGTVFDPLADVISPEPNGPTITM